jgi:N-acetylmuramic acid 6-phosphate etherase
MLSTGVMIRLGFVYGNLMVNVQPTNQKLLARARRIVQDAAGVDPKEAARLLTEACNRVRTAIVMARRGVGRDQAEALLAFAGGRISAALELELQK